MSDIIVMKLWWILYSKLAIKNKVRASKISSDFGEALCDPKKALKKIMKYIVKCRLEKEITKLSRIDEFFKSL